jgi:hypothetical protein
VRPECLEPVANLMGMYIHFRKQSAYTVRAMRRGIGAQSPLGPPITA